MSQLLVNTRCVGCRHREGVAGRGVCIIIFSVDVKGSSCGTSRSRHWYQAGSERSTTTAVCAVGHETIPSRQNVDAQTRKGSRRRLSRFKLHTTKVQTGFTRTSTAVHAPAFLPPNQELFPVFVLNLECPRSEVDIMSDPEKTWVEFSDWAAARNACISMLLVSWV